MSMEWYYEKDDEQQGPVSVDELQRLAASGVLSPENLVWNEDMDDWMAASEVKGLFASVSVARTKHPPIPRLEPLSLSDEEEAGITANPPKSPGRKAFLWVLVAVTVVIAIGIASSAWKARGLKQRAEASMASSHNLRRLGEAIREYEFDKGHLPQDIVDRNGKPILSWRVAILPYLGERDLYLKFNLDEPWDSSNNKRWSQAVIKTYLSPRVKESDPAGKTHYKAFTGPGTVFEPGKKINLNEIIDGTSNTIMLIETADSIEWAKPGDIPFDPKKPLPKLPFVEGAGSLLVGLADGSVRSISRGVKDETIKAAITRNGNETLGDDWN